jgi:hypothetical protein
MKTFLEQPTAAFYHITTLERWESIKRDGKLKSDFRGEIHVSLSGEFPILMDIAINELPEYHETENLVLIRLPQAKNHFTSKEIIENYQANDEEFGEWTKPFQKIIKRAEIPFQNIELMMIIKDMGKEEDCSRIFLNKIFGSIITEAKNEYEQSSIFQFVKQLKHEKLASDRDT